MNFELIVQQCEATAVTSVFGVEASLTDDVSGTSEVTCSVPGRDAFHLAMIIFTGKLFFSFFYCQRSD